MATGSTNNLSLKLLVDKKANKVLFAEAGKDFVDFLFSLLSLPIGTVIRILKNASIVGCIGNLYESLENLNGAYMQPNQSKDSLLNPHISNPATNVPFLLPGTGTDLKSTKRRFCACPDYHSYVTDNMYTKCPYCNDYMNREMKFIKSASRPDSSIEGGYVKGLVTYMVTDDLTVSTMSMISGVSLLNKFNVKDFSALQEMVVEFGIDEGLELLRASLQSKETLTSVFLLKKVKDNATSN